MNIIIYQSSQEEKEKIIKNFQEICNNYFNQKNLDPNTPSKIKPNTSQQDENGPQDNHNSNNNPYDILILINNFIKNVNEIDISDIEQLPECKLIKNILIKNPIIAYDKLKKIIENIQEIGPNSHDDLRKIFLNIFNIILDKSSENSPIKEEFFNILFLCKNISGLASMLNKDLYKSQDFILNLYNIYDAMIQDKPQEKEDIISLISCCFNNFFIEKTQYIKKYLNEINNTNINLKFLKFYFTNFGYIEDTYDNFNVLLKNYNVINNNNSDKIVKYLIEYGGKDIQKDSKYLLSYNNSNKHKEIILKRIHFKSKNQENTSWSFIMLIITPCGIFLYIIIQNVNDKYSENNEKPVFISATINYNQFKKYLSDEPKLK